jgi:hypothetical protein
MFTQNDKHVLTNYLSDHYAKRDPYEVMITNTIIFKAERAKKLLDTLRSGISMTIDTECPNILTDMICDLLHLRQYAMIHGAVFNNWDCPTVSHINTQLSDAVYLEMANDAKQWHDIVSEELFEITLSDLLMMKVKNDESKVDKVLRICMDLIGQEWLKSGMIKSLKTA